MRNLIFVLLISLISVPGLSQLSTQTIEIADDHVLTAHYSKAKKGKQTVVLLNGLIYDMDNWETYVNEMTKDGIGVLLLAYSTQPESLAGLNFKAPYFAKRDGLQGLETQDLVDEVMFAVDSLGIKKFNLQTLSYGSFVGLEIAKQFKDRVQNLILTAPAMKLSNRYQPIFKERHDLYASQRALKALNPFVFPFYDPEATYNFELTETLKMNVGQQRGSFGERGVEFETFLDGVTQMVLATKWTDVLDYSDSDLPNTHLFLASEEDAKLSSDQHLFWDRLKESSAGKSRVVFESGYHALTGSAPLITAREAKLVLAGKSKGERSVDVRAFQESLKKKLEK